eukprot:CAMPEP_0119466134 /NCGR_PEP_ID=MMETSP1344-20130328/926_1 /TAXON_ID=236787 /ORGANISM="Florenciella parvula, Strain CCMP2471" /LENGTH=466 /DNA_ID=CAMNT_0007498431 /DNA_START=373 /DNA_END=1773 /DNA_ORIENTATION=+
MVLLATQPLRGAMERRDVAGLRVAITVTEGEVEAALAILEEAKALLLKLPTEALMEAMQMANNGSTKSLVALEASIVMAEAEGVDAGVIEEAETLLATQPLRVAMVHGDGVELGAAITQAKQEVTADKAVIEGAMAQLKELITEVLTKSSDLAMVRWALDEAEKSEAGVDVAVIEAAKARLLQLVAKHEARSLSMLNDILIIRVLFYLDRPDLLLIAAVLSKDMNKNTKSDLLWRLTITERHDMSAMVISANRHNVSTMGPGYGLATPTDGQAAEGEHLWYGFYMSVTREGLHREGGSALLTAAKGGDVAKLGKLLWAMVDVEARSNDAWQMTSLMWAAYNGHVECTRLLIEAGSDVTAKNGRLKRTSLMLAAHNGHVECARLLIEAGSDVTAKDVSQRGQGYNGHLTSLMLAAIYGHVECTRLLIEAGSDVTAKSDYRNTAKDLAQQEGHPAVVALLEEAMQQAS